MPSFDEFPPWFWYAVLIPFGLAWGSFLNVVIYRLPRDESVARPASRCPACGTPIRAWNNIPVLSYVLLRGRASCCGARISPRYPLIEASGGLLAWAILRCIVFEQPAGASLAHALGLFAIYLALGLALLALSFIDLEYMLLPDSLTLGGAALGLASAGFRGTGYVTALVGGVVGFLVIYLPFDLLHRKLRGYPGMGLGDAKLTLLAGAWFGIRGAVFALFAGAIQATLVVLATFIVRGKIEEPEAVRLERLELEAAIEAASGEERAELERERELDPAMRAPEEGLQRARVPFGPFLALATLEYALLEQAGLESLFDLFTDVWS